MPTIQRSIAISAPAHAIWALVADPRRVSDWMPDITGRDILSAGLIGAGTRWREKGLLRGKDYAVQYEVTIWEPPARMAYQRIAASDNAYAWVETVTLEPAGDATNVTLRLDYDMPGGIVGQLYDRILFRKDFTITLDNRLERLQSIFAAAQPPAPTEPGPVSTPPPRRRIKRAGVRKE